MAVRKHRVRRMCPKMLTDVVGIALIVDSFVLRLVEPSGAFPTEWPSADRWHAQISRMLTRRRREHRSLRGLRGLPFPLLHPLRLRASSRGCREATRRFCILPRRARRRRTSVHSRTLAHPQIPSRRGNHCRCIRTPPRMLPSFSLPPFLLPPLFRISPIHYHKTFPLEWPGFSETHPGT